jgi:hypothetical protein
MRKLQTLRLNGNNLTQIDGLVRPGAVRRVGEEGGG